MLDRRGFLIGLFGAAAVAAAGPLPKAMLEAPEDKFVNRARYFAALKEAASKEPQIWGDDEGTYSFSPLPGFRPLREESDKLASQALSALWKEFSDALPR
jgi:hypothetical protein